MEAVEPFALVAGHVDKELLLRNEYLAAENEILLSKLITDYVLFFIKIGSREVHAERYVRSVKEERLSRIFPFGEEGLRRALKEFVAHYHEERNHQGRDNLLLFSSVELPSSPRGDAIKCKQRLGGMLKYYYREGA